MYHALLIKERKESALNRNFRLSLAGNIASTLAGVLYNFCTGLFILDITQSALAMSCFLGYSCILGLIVQPFAGVCIENKEKVKVMYITDGIFAMTDFLLAALLFFTSSGGIVMFGLYVNATVNTIMNALFEPASAALTPMIVESEKLTRAYSWFSIVNNLSNIFATAFAAVLFSVIPYKWILVINGSLIGVSAVFEYFIDFKEEIAHGNENADTYMRDLKAGFAYLKGKNILLQISACAIIINFFMSGVFSISFPYLYNSVLVLPAIYLASIQIAMSVGSIIMASCLTKVEIKQKGKKIPQGFCVIAGIFFAVFVSYMLYTGGSIKIEVLHGIIFIGAFIFGIVAVTIQIPINIIYACNVEKEYMGRIMAIRKTLSTITAPCAMMLFGLILDYSDIKWAFAIAGIGTFFSVVFAYRQKELMMQ